MIIIYRMCLVRLKQEGRDGKQVITMMNKVFWIDIGDRIDMMGRIDARVVIDNKRQLARHFYGVILAYDEVCIIWIYSCCDYWLQAILSHDIVLAAAIWKWVWL